MKGVALLWVFLNHASERIFGFPYVSNPNNTWPSLQDRIQQLQPLAGHGVWDIPINLFRYVGWSGEQGVQLFLILSGFGLTLGLLKKHGVGSFPIADFYKRRAVRIYPQWLLLHAVVLFPMVFLDRIHPDEAGYWLSLIGIRVTPETLYFINPAWWYIGLLLQLYLIYPVLWSLLTRKGPLWMLTMTLGVSFVARGTGLLFFDEYMDAWSRGAIFITRLPEFVVGMSLAFWCWKSPHSFRERLRSIPVVVLSLVLYVVGGILAVDLLGMTLSPFLLGVGMFGLLYVPLKKLDESRNAVVQSLRWVGVHSYSIFLVHCFFVSALIPLGSGMSYLIAALALVVAFLLSVGFALLIERAAGGIVGFVKTSRRSGRPNRLILLFAGLLVVVVVVLGHT